MSINCQTLMPARSAFLARASSAGSKFSYTLRNWSKSASLFHSAFVRIDSVIWCQGRVHLPSLAVACDSFSGWMQLKLSSLLSLHGYMTILRSAPYQSTRLFPLSTRGLVIGSSRPACLGIKKRKAALPEPNSLASLMTDLDFD